MGDLGELKIPKGTIGLMIAVAFVCDLITIGVDFITVGLGGLFCDICTAVIFSLWFSHYGVSLGSSRNAWRTILAILLDAFPVSDLTFPWTCQVAYTALTERHPAPIIKQDSKPKPTSGSWRIRFRRFNLRNVALLRPLLGERCRARPVFFKSALERIDDRRI